LQVQRCFIASEHHRLRSGLCHIGQFFSSASSKAAICRSERDL
jgi:hypothetical protein